MSIVEGAIIGGKLKLVRPLAKGGMGAVWVARHQTLDTDVAVKFMEGSIAENESARARFEREAKAAALIKSPHVVQVLDYGIEGTTPYIVMELMEGEDLDALLARRGPLSIEETYRILEPVGKALRRAHELGIVHRDLKPGNIFIARHGEDETVKILDFGIAKDVAITGSASATSSGMMLGSPSYMSPEQIRETKQVDHRSDLWSVGVILYEALTGRVPFDESENIGKLLVSICTDSFMPPSVHKPELGPEVDKFFEKALARDKTARFQNMGELVETFGELAGIRPMRRSGSLPEGLPRVSAVIDRSGVAGTDVTIAADTAVIAKSDANLQPARGGDARSTLSPAESGSFSGSPRKRLVPIALAALVVIAAAVAFVVTRKPKNPETTASGDPTTSMGAGTNAGAQTGTPSISPAEALRSVRLAIEPANASVEVNGRPVSVDRDGFVTINGTLGSTHAVRVFKDGREVRSDVSIVDGGAIPAKLALAGATDAAGKPATTAVVPKDKPDPTPTPATTKTTPTAGTTTTTKDPKTQATTTTKDPQPVRDFQ